MRMRGDIDVYDPDGGFSPDDRHALVFHDVGAQEEVVCGEVGELDRLVDKGEQIPTPSVPRAVTPNRRVSREVSVGGG